MGFGFGSVVISSGHGKYVRGAAGILDEVDEARRVVDHVASILKTRSVDVKTFHDNESHSQNENLNRIVDYHNKQERELDISVHFNAYEQVDKPMGVEVLYVTDNSLAAKMSSAIAACGFINRGPKKRTDLAFLNNTEEKALLIEVCFVDSEADADLYQNEFDMICEAIADTISEGGDDSGDDEKPIDALVELTGKVSHFGGPEDTGVSPSEGLAFIQDMEQAPHLFLPYQPSGTSGLARRLNPYIHYIACRWEYDVTSREMLLKNMALVRSTKTDVALLAFPADWGPHVDTERVADISPGLMTDLGITTDDEVEVIFPFNGD